MPLAAHAQGFQDVSLSWVRVAGAEGCIGAHALAQAVQQRIGHAVWVATGDAQLSVEGYVRPLSPEGFEAIVVTANPEGEIIGRRELNTLSGDCRSLDAPLALVIALTIDPESGFVPLPSIIQDTDEADLASLLDAPQPSPEQEMAAQPPPGPAPPTDPVPPQTADETTADSGELSRWARLPLRGAYAAPLVGGGYASGATGGIAGGYLWTRNRVPAGVEARFWMPRSDALGQGTYRFSSQQLSLYGCPLWGHAVERGLEGQLCVGASPSLTEIGSEDSRRQTRVGLDAELAARVVFHTPSAITPFLGVVAGFVMYGVVLRERASGEPRELWRSPPVRVTVSAGVLFRR